MSRPCRGLPLLALLGFALLTAAGCNWKKLPEVAGSESKTPTTPVEIAAAVEKVLQPVFDILPTLTRQTPITAAFAEPIKTQLRDAVQKYGGTDAGKQALNDVEHHLEEVLPQARDAQNGQAVMFICDLIRIIEPENTRIGRFVEWATIERNRPEVLLRGWFVDNDADPPVTYAFIEVYLPETGEVEHLRVREGDEFLGLKFKKIIGKRRGMLLEYEKTGDLFEVYFH